MDKLATKSSSSSGPIHGVKWENHVQNIFQQDRLLSLKENKALIDVILEAKFPDGTKKQIPTHKLILSLASQYFWDQLVDGNSYIPFSSTASSPIHLRVPGVDPLALETLINFIYSGKLEMTENLVGNLYVAAELLQISVIQTKCTDYMIANINKDTCGPRLEFARDQNCNELFRAVVNYINRNYTDFLSSPDFLRLHFTEVVTVLNTPRRLETPEETIFMSILHWLNHDDVGRIKYSAPLLKELDLRHLAEDFLQFHFDTQKVLHSYESLAIYKKFIKSVTTRKKVDEDINNKISCTNNSNNDDMVPNNSIEDEIYCVPPLVLPKTKNPHEKNYDDIDGVQKKKRRIENISSDTKTVESFLTLSSSVPIKLKPTARKRTGGNPPKHQHHEQSSTTDVRFTSEEDLKQPQCKKKTWNVGPSMKQERNNFVAVVLDDYIYAFGGSEGILGNQAVNCAERLSLTSKNAKWEERDYLQRARQGFGAAVLDGKIFVAGGYGALDDEEDCTMGILNTVECYDPKKDEWSFIASMQYERHGLSLVAYNGLLYAIGGGGNKSHISFQEDIPNMKSVEVYDKQTNKWNFIASMNCPRKNGSAVVLNGKLYAIAGDHTKGEDRLESSIEVYDPIQDKWTKIMDTIDNLGNFTSVTVWDSPDI